MKPVYQDILGEGGNCFSACLASILEVPLDELRDFHRRYVEGCVEWDRMTPRERIEFQTDRDGECFWMVLLSKELAPRWLLPVCVSAYSIQRHGCPKPSGYAIAQGEGGSGMRHACVAFDGRIVHDPSPNGGGLDVVDSYVLILPATVEPWPL